MQIRLPLLALLVAGAVALPARAEIQNYKFDNTHSFANWEIRHVVAHTSGTFSDVQGKIILDTDNIAKSSVEANISVYSLNSSYLKRDIHVLTDDYLGVRDYPDMKFVSTRVSPVTPERGTLTGNLTLHGVTKPVTLDYQILGLGKDPWGGMRIGFKATTRLNRADYGITKGIPYGPVGSEVDITLLIEGIRLDEDGQPWNAVKAQEQNPKVISFPAPVEAAPQPVPVTTPATPPQPATAAPATPTAQPTQEAAPDKPESVEDQLKKKLLKGLFN
jgi:polyisoprenoid-binding protein YceI